MPAARLAVTFALAALVVDVLVGIIVRVVIRVLVDRVGRLLGYIKAQHREVPNTSLASAPPLHELRKFSMTRQERPVLPEDRLEESALLVLLLPRRHRDAHVVQVDGLRMVPDTRPKSFLRRALCQQSKVQLFVGVHVSTILRDPRVRLRINRHGPIVPVPIFRAESLVRLAAELPAPSSGREK